jgi:hypothetical protein
MRHILILSAFSAALAACVVTSPPSSQGEVGIAVAPLTLPQLSKVCYDLRVTNDAGGAGSTVWAEGDPNVDGPADTGAICSNTYGNGASGDITFIGACDASPKNPGDTGRTNSVTIWVDALYTTSNAVISPSGNDGWQDPCPNGCTLETLCRENTDTSVEFNLTILRQANQGFFDIAVTFDDIFCSAKVDCVNSQNQPLDLLFNPATGQRDTTIVSAFACTAGPGAGSNTELFRDPLVVTCGTSSTSLDPTAGLGNAYTTTNPDPKADAIWQYAIYAGDEALTCSGAPCNKLYWNVAIGLDETVDNCVLTTRMTAARLGQLTSFTTPSGTTYPYIDIIVPLSNPTGLQCTKHPVNGGNGVTTNYTPIASPEEFSHKFDGNIFSNSDSDSPSSIPPGTGAIFELDGANYTSGSTWTDVSGRSNHGTLVAGPPHSSLNGGFLTFDGSTQYTTLPANQDFNLGTSDFTLISYIRTSTFTDDGGYYRRIFALGADGNRAGNFQLILNSTSGAPQIFTTSGQLDTTASVSVSDNSWHQVTVTRSSNTFRIYVDGELAGSQTHTNTLSNLGTQPLIGRYTIAGGGRFVGSIGRIVLLPKALSGAEVLTDFATYKTRFAITTGACTAAPTLLLDASSYTVPAAEWSDTSENGLNATLFNSPVFSASFGGYFAFNGSTHYATLPNSASFNLGSQNFSLVTYVRTSTYSSDSYYRRIFALSNGGNRADNFQLILDTGSGSAYMWSNSGALDKVGLIPISDNVWHQVAVTRIGGTFRLYVDGVLDVTQNYAGVMTNNNTTPVIGRYQSTSSAGRFNGSIAKLALIPCGLSSSQVATDFEGHRTRFGR